jgi:hypothetical protein
MLLPSFLQNSYKQYKDDTNRFATWLVNVAKKAGHEPARLPPASAGKKKRAGKFESLHYLTSKHRFGMEKSGLVF